MIMKRNLDRIIENKELLFFAGGAIAAIAGKKILESKKTRECAVNSAAKLMQFQDEAEETFLNIKEDAEDIKHDAEAKNKKEKVDIK